MASSSVTSRARRSAALRPATAATADWSAATAILRFASICRRVSTGMFFMSSRARVLGDSARDELVEQQTPLAGRGDEAGGHDVHERPVAQGHGHDVGDESGSAGDPGGPVLGRGTGVVAVGRADLVDPGGDTAVAALVAREEDFGGIEVDDGQGDAGRLQQGVSGRTPFRRRERTLDHGPIDCRHDIPSDTHSPPLGLSVSEQEFLTCAG